MKVSFNGISLAVLLASLLIAPVSAVDYSAAFNKLDVDGDGFITDEEALAHPELPAAFTEGDEDEDGRLSLDEFSKLEISDD